MVATLMGGKGLKDLSQFRCTGISFHRFHPLPVLIRLSIDPPTQSTDCVLVAAVVSVHRGQHSNDDQHRIHHDSRCMTSRDTIPPETIQPAFLPFLPSLTVVVAAHLIACFLWAIRCRWYCHRRGSCLTSTHTDALAQPPKARSFDNEVDATCCVCVRSQPRTMAFSARLQYILYEISRCFKTVCLSARSGIVEQIFVVLAQPAKNNPRHHDPTRDYAALLCVFPS